MAGRYVKYTVIMEKQYRRRTNNADEKISAHWYFLFFFAMTPLYDRCSSC